MKINTIKTATKTFAFAALIAGGLTTSRADITTGWQTTLDSGIYSWDDTANWVDGVINGIFSSDLTASGKLSTTIEIPNGLVLTDQLGFYYSVSDAHSLNFKGSDGDGMLTVNCPIEVALTGNTSKGAYVMFGATSSGSKLKVLFGDASGIVLNAGGVRFRNEISANALTVSGDNSSVGLLGLQGDDAHFEEGFSPVFRRNKGLYVVGDKYSKGTTRGSGIVLENAIFAVDGNEGSVETNVFSGTLTLSGGLNRFACNSNNKYFGQVVKVGSIVRNGGAMLTVHKIPSFALGGEDSAKGSTKLIVDSGVQTAGSGLTGAAACPVVPWARLATPSSNISTSDSIFSGLLTYESENGFRPLDTTEYETVSDANASYTPSVENANVRVTAAGTVAFAGETTVNSITMFSSSATTITATNGTLHVVSGVLDITSSADNATFDGDVDFGTATGYITCNAGKRSYLKGSVAGVDVVLGDNLLNPNRNPVFNITSAGSFSGNLYVNGCVAMGNAAFLPGGDRTGDVYVNGILQADNFTINGLYGKGTVNRAFSGTKNMFVGDNNSSGDFDGVLSVTDNGSTLTKIGTGTQRFGGTVTLASNGAININAGAVMIDGAVTQGAVNVAAGAAIGGSGGITNNLVFASGAKLAVPVFDGVASCLTVAGTVSGGPVTVNANVTGKTCRDAQCILKSDNEITATFVKGASVGALELRNNGTELWASPKVPGFKIVFR